jgi:uncharacterized membrane protein
MENKNVGWLVIALAAVMVVIIFLFNSALREIVLSSCGMAHGPSAASCPMNQTINQQTYLSLAIAAILMGLGIFLLFSKPKEKIVVKKYKEKEEKKEVDLSGLNKDEKEVYGVIAKEETVFQADLIEKMGFGKAKMTRIIDRLEGRGLVERKRRGLTNVVVLKD